jgi:hypothetical protein
MNMKCLRFLLPCALLQAAVVALLTFARVAAAQSSTDPASHQLWVTMHTAPIEDYCAPCIASEKLLKDEHVEFKKVLEPMGPWPWFQLTDSRGNQKRIKGALSKEDVQAIKRGEFPRR